MTRLCQLILGLAILTVAFTASAQAPLPLPSKIPAGSTNFPPLPPPLQSPVTFFRQLLAMSPSERNLSLTNRAPEARARILAKVREYQALNPDERELRLCATDLRWYLTPLFRLAPADRPARLAQVPDDLRELAKSRLAQWDQVPPALQKEFLANDRTLHYFAHVETANNSAAGAESQKIAAQFNQFFELTPEEKQQTLTTLSDAERAQMEKTLESFEQLPPQQRRLCVKNYARFAGMSFAERTDFLKNAEHWSQLSPQERKTWRDLVATVPIWPPMPPLATPPNLMPPHVSPKPARPNMVTN